jgi:hypothetical protein
VCIVERVDADQPHSGEPGTVRVHLNDVRYLISALGSMAAEMAGVIVGDDPMRLGGSVRDWQGQ